MKMLAAMFALAVSLMINGATEIWQLVDAPAENWVQTTAAPETVQPSGTPIVTTTAPPSTDGRACVTVPVYTEDDGDVFLGPQSERTYTNGLEPGDIRVSMVGHYLNIAFGYDVTADADSWEMELTSIDATELDEVTICE